MSMREYIFIICFFGIPAVTGAVLAHRRKKNPLLWGLLSAPFPFFIFILWFQKPDHEIPGSFRKCANCGGIYPWRSATCSYCGTPH